MSVHPLPLMTSLESTLVCNRDGKETIRGAMKRNGQDEEDMRTGGEGAGAREEGQEKLFMFSTKTGKGRKKEKGRRRTKERESAAAEVNAVPVPQNEVWELDAEEKKF
ncbi:hypothetical protein CHS0354_022643 [Potamilus streckersoni]|uniref:Uncharacterized protein n=1 Tax=Potamilus streckersoni TaxID=2493646 RepID=A0AAE0TGY2_9BIVA|nr:hypothetical protein CHS0354_022643 [Potamilus streckersoni]